MAHALVDSWCNCPAHPRQPFPSPGDPLADLPDSPTPAQQHLTVTRSPPPTWIRVRSHAAVPRVCLAEQRHRFQACLTMSYRSTYAPGRLAEPNYGCDCCATVLLSKTPAAVLTPDALTLTRPPRSCKDRFARAGRGRTSLATPRWRRRRGRSESRGSSSQMIPSLHTDA